MSKTARGWPGRALVAARSAEPRAAPSWRAVGADVVLAVVGATASLTAAVYAARGHAPVLLVPAKAHFYGSPGGSSGQLYAGAVFIALLTTLPLALRRICPLTVFWVVLLGTVFATQYANVVTFIAIVLAAYSAVAHSRFRDAAVICVPLAAVVVTAAFPNTTPPLPGRFTALLVLVPVVLVGSAIRMWRRRAGDSQARLQRVTAEHEAATTRALAAERSRIAAELHDVVTHNVSVMVVQAGAARRVMAGSPDDATTALLAVEGSGRAAMTELQHLLGLLSPAEGMQPPDTGPLRPQPGLDQLRPLICRVAATGLPVDLTITGQPTALQPGVDLTAYRVVQEALTNVIKHAPLARTAVSIGYREGELLVDVADDGSREAVATGAPAMAGSAGGGRGLLGLRERVRLYDGEFDAGPRLAGGWRVTARLPLPSRGDFAAGGLAEDSVLTALSAPT